MSALVHGSTVAVDGSDPMGHDQRTDRDGYVHAPPLPPTTDIFSAYLSRLDEFDPVQPGVGIIFIRCSILLRALPNPTSPRWSSLHA